ncbi:organic cation/carnitine transporter 7-like isoform X1 [Populus alba x Populus x berolinensis]|nr:organic cation/carnitine transporter 7-like isoform X1 [Populus alba x Populus x berolinensis]
MIMLLYGTANFCKLYPTAVRTTGRRRCRCRREDRWHDCNAKIGLEMATCTLFFTINCYASPLFSSTRVSKAHDILEKIARLSQSKLPPGMLVSDSTIGLDEDSSASEYTPLLSSTRKINLDFGSGFSSFFEGMPVIEAESSIGVRGMDDEAPAYTLDEALACLGFGKFQGLVLAYAGLGWFAEAMELMLLSFVGPTVKSQWGLSSGQESLLSTVVFAGMLVGAYSWGLGFLGIAVLTSGAGLLSTFSPNYESLVIIRCLVGLGLGGSTVLCSWFLEFVPAPHRGKWMVVFSTFWTLGAISEASLAWLVMQRLSWRWLLAFSSLPSIALLLFYGIVPESPRYLCMKGRINDAHKILQKMALLNQSELPPGMLVPDSTVEQEEKSAPSKHTPLLSSTRKVIVDFKSVFSSFFMLFSSTLIQTTLLLWVLLFGNVFSYYGIILLTSELSSQQGKCGSTILSSENLQNDSLYINVFVTSLAELPGLLLSAIIVDRLGRKLSMALMLALGCIFLFPLLFNVSANLTTAMLFGARMCVMGSFTIATLYAPELYPTAVRATGAGVASSVGRIGGMICPLVAVGLVTGCYLTEAIILFEVVMAISAFSSLLFPFETKGQELSDSVDHVSDSIQVASFR